MSRRAIFLPIALLASLAISLLAQEPPKPTVQERAEALLDRARQLSDIRAKDAPAFRLKATFSFTGDNLDPVEGTYTETWVSDTQWRRETVIGNLRQIDVAGPGKHWLVYPDGFPDQANAVPSLMAYLPSASQNLEFALIRERTASDMTADCAFRRPVIENFQFVFCFEKKSGVLLERVSPEKRLRNVVRTACDYGTFRKFGDYTFPREVVCFEDRHKKISASVVELSVEPPLDPALFDPPAGAIEVGQCSGKREPPSFSMDELILPGLDPERMAWLRIWFVVDAKGKAQQIRVLHSASKVSNAKALDTVRSWHFKPGTCEGKPMPMTMTLEIPSTPH
jgi:TonB family protein